MILLFSEVRRFLPACPGTLPPNSELLCSVSHKLYFNLPYCLNDSHTITYDIDSSVLSFPLYDDLSIYKYGNHLGLDGGVLIPVNANALTSSRVKNSHCSASILLWYIVLAYVVLSITFLPLRSLQISLHRNVFWSQRRSGFILTMEFTPSTSSLNADLNSYVEGVAGLTEPPWLT